MAARATKMASPVERLNASAGCDGARWTHEGAVPFGGDTVQRYRLGNGLTLLLLVDKSAPVVSYFTWFRVGSRHERSGKTGLAHLFEHLMFSETDKLKAGELDRRLEERGAQSNAATSFDWTYYYEALPKDGFKLAVDLESQRMSRLVLRDAQIAREKAVVANERRVKVDDVVEGRANELLYKTAFTCHPYHWPTIGWMSDIQSFEPSDCHAFYRTYYAPNNATVVVCGDVREADVLTRIRDAYGTIPSSELPPEDTHPEPPQLEERVQEVKSVTASEKVLIGYRGPALGEPDHAPLTVLNEVLFGGRASRLYKRCVLEREIATELRGWVSTLRDPGLYEMYATVRSGCKVAEVESEIDDQVAVLKREVVSAAELARAIARLERATLQSLETTSGKAKQIGFYDTVLGDPSAAFRRLEAYRRVTAGELRTVARRYLVASARTIVRVLSERQAAHSVSGAE
jgi:zinc protease